MDRNSRACSVSSFSLLGELLRPQEAVGEAVAGVGMVGDAHVVQHGEVGEQADVLERPRDAQPRDLERLQAVDPLFAERTIPRGQVDQAGDEVENGGLARSVGTDQAPQDALRQGEAEVLDRAQAAEELRELWMSSTAGAVVVVSAMSGLLLLPVPTARRGGARRRRALQPPEDPRPACRNPHSTEPSSPWGRISMRRRSVMG